MNRTQALRHLFHVMKRTEGMVHWQVSTRITLISLYLDGRVTTKLRDELDGLISSGQFLNEDHVINRV